MALGGMQAERKKPKLTKRTVSKLSDSSEPSDRSDLFRQHTALNRCYRLPCKLVERRDTHLEVLFLRVFDFVVADAVETLDEHHDGRHAGAGDFGGIVERTGGKTMSFAAGLGDGIGAHFN